MSHAMQGHLRQMAHSEECWWNKVYWRRKWQITPVFLTWESQVKYVKAKRCDTRSLGPKLEGIQYATGEEQLPLAQKWMKQIGQSKNDPQSWMCPLVKVKSDVVRNILHRNLECYRCVCGLCVLVSQLCLTLCYPMDCSRPGFSVRGILQARVLDCVTIPFSREFFPTQGSNLGLLHCRWILYYLSHQGSLVKSINQGKLDVVNQKMVRFNVDILISELK